MFSKSVFMAQSRLEENLKRVVTIWYESMIFANLRVISKSFENSKGYALESSHVS